MASKCRQIVGIYREHEIVLCTVTVNQYTDEHICATTRRNNPYKQHFTMYSIFLKAVVRDVQFFIIHNIYKCKTT